MNFEITGKLVVKYDTQHIKDTFKKREFVIETSEEVNGSVYTNFIKMQLVQNRCELLDRYNEGDLIKVNFGLKGNRWEKDGKANFITNLDAWRIENASASNSQNLNTVLPSVAAAANVAATVATAAATWGANPTIGGGDDLPF